MLLVKDSLKLVFRSRVYSRLLPSTRTLISLARSLSAFFLDDSWKSGRALAANPTPT